MSEMAFLAFSLGPVQSFISSARTTRDLWSGSYLLSWLTYRAMEPVRDLLIFPDLAQPPLWHWEEAGRPKPGTPKVLEPCLPNRFLAEVGAGDAERLRGECEEKCRKALNEVGEKVRQALELKL